MDVNCVSHSNTTKPTEGWNSLNWEIKTQRNEEKSTQGANGKREKFLRWKIKNTMELQINIELRILIGNFGWDFLGLD